MGKVLKIAFGIVYLIICILDFIIIPGYILAKVNKINSYKHYIEIREIYKDNPEAVQIILADGREVGEWTPFSLRTGGVFHISFGAILTGSILGRKKED